MGKTRVGVILKDKLGGNKSSNKSADLQALLGKYDEFCKRIVTLIAALNKHKESMVTMDETRLEVRWYGSYC